MKQRLLLAILLSITAQSMSLASEAPLLLPFQGRLTDPDGTAITHWVRVVQFKIFDTPTGGIPVWAGEVHRTSVNGDIVNVLLGSKTPLTGVDFNQQLYLEVTVDIDGDNAITAADPLMLPRQAILPVLFAREAEDSRRLNGADWSPIFGTNNPNVPIPGSKLADASLPGTKVQPGSITGPQIASGTIGGTNIVPESLTSTQIADGTLSSNKFDALFLRNILIPTGSITAFMGTNVPARWLLCDGAAIGRTQYAALFNVIGVSSGAGDGSATFNLPDLRGMFLRGVNGTRSDTNYWDPDATTRANIFPGGSTGNAVGSVQLDQFRNHVHGGVPTFHAPFGQYGDGVRVDGGFTTTQPAGGAETRPKNVYVNYIIKY